MSAESSTTGSGSTDVIANLFQAYFESTASPTLQNFIEENYVEVKNHVREGENIEQVWATRYIAAAVRFKSATVFGHPDWSLLTSGSPSGTKSQKSLGKRTASSSAGPSSMSLGGKRLKRLTDYLGEKAHDPIAMDPDCDQWNIDGTPVTEFFVQYRQRTIEKARERRLNTLHEELSLNSIFFIDTIGFDSDPCLVYGLNKNIWTRMVDECRGLFNVEDLSDATAQYLMEFAKAARKNFKDCKDLVNRFSVSLPDESDCIKNSMRKLFREYSPTSIKKPKKDESSFIIDAVIPIILPFLDQMPLITRKGTDGQTPGPDIPMVYNYGNLPEQALTIVDIKQPSDVLHGEHPNLVKLANELKDSIDKMVRDGLDDSEISVTGILVEGLTCTVFIMDLAYQATYRLIPLGVFYLPRSRHDFSVLPNAYELMFAVRSLLETNAERLHAFYRERQLETVRGGYIVESFDDTPTLH